MPVTLVRWTLACLGGILAGAAIVTWLTGGGRLDVGGVAVVIRDWTRPALAALACLGGWVALAGFARTRTLIARVGPDRWASAGAIVLATGSLLVAVRHNGWTASGADQYAYVSQMDLLLAGRLAEPMPLAAEAPWPNAIAAFAPFGYRPSPDGTAIVPVTPPGFPLIMAGAKRLAGHCGAFLVPPLAAAMLVWAAFAIGRRVAGPGVGLGGAWLLATSPVVLAMAKATMSDIPAAALWALATAAVLRPGVTSAAAGGLAAGAAVLVRPHLAPLAAVMTAWLLGQRSRGEGAVARARPAFAFAVATAPGVIALTWMSARMHGSPLASGYGDPAALFSLSHVPPNLWRHAQWLTQTQSPLAWAGVIALGGALAGAWPDPRREARAGARLLAWLAVCVVVIHALYLPFEAWWFLRFLLAAWPALGVAVAMAVIAVGARGHRTGRLAAMAVLVVTGLYTATTAVRLGEFPPGEGERRYASLALHVARITEPAAVIVAGQHAGPLRYYAGRLTLRFDQIDPAWLQAATAWLRARGHPTYYVLEDWEIPRFARHFGLPGDDLLGLAPVLAYKAHRVEGVAYLFDPARREGPTVQPPPERDPRPRCVPPAARR